MIQFIPEEIVLLIFSHVEYITFARPCEKFDQAFEAESIPAEKNQEIPVHISETTFEIASLPTFAIPLIASHAVEKTARIEARANEKTLLIASHALDKEYVIAVHAVDVASFTASHIAMTVVITSARDVPKRLRILSIITILIASHILPIVWKTLAIPFHIVSAVFLIDVQASEKNVVIPLTMSNTFDPRASKNHVHALTTVATMSRIPPQLFCHATYRAVIAATIPSITHPIGHIATRIEEITPTTADPNETRRPKLDTIVPTAVITGPRTRPTAPIVNTIPARVAANIQSPVIISFVD